MFTDAFLDCNSTGCVNGMKVTVAVLNKEGKNSVDQVLDVLKLLGSEQPSQFGLMSPKKSLLGKNVDILRKQSSESSTVIGYVSSKSSAASDYEFLQLDEASLMFEGRIYSPIPKEAALEQLTRNLNTAKRSCKPYSKKPTATTPSYMLKMADCRWKRPSRSSTALLSEKTKTSPR